MLGSITCNNNLITLPNLKLEQVCLWQTNSVFVKADEPVSLSNTNT